MMEKSDTILKDLFKQLPSIKMEDQQLVNRIMSRIALDLSIKIKYKNRLVNRLSMVGGLLVFLFIAFIIVWHINQGWDPFSSISNMKLSDITTVLIDSSWSKFLVAGLTLYVLLARGFAAVLIMRKGSERRRLL